MKKIIATLGFFAIIIFGTYLYFTTDKVLAPQQTLYAKYSDSKPYVHFSYRTGPDGYVIKEIGPHENDPNILSTIVVMRTEDAKNPPPVNSEGPPTITITVTTNRTLKSSKDWALSNSKYSNINLKTSDIVQTTVGGLPAIRYTTDGLYLSDTIVVVDQSYAYVISGMYSDSNSDIKRDFEPLVQSLTFEAKYPRQF